MRYGSSILEHEKSNIDCNKHCNIDCNKKMEPDTPKQISVVLIINILKAVSFFVKNTQ
jgi:hypothetical protein